ncbi:MAG: hypothetical protein EPO11_10400 [Gammaproteobacteria bacterium]|nr:MAG: hypothetical protein EPO11_10400 [Gammaproteobacteria bacterium]
MFGKNKVFLFQAPMQKKVTKSINTTYEYKVQVIVCGSYAQDVIAAMDHPELAMTKEQDIYAFQYSRKGRINGEITVTINSNMNYQEARKKKKKDVIFEHQDDIAAEISSSESPLDSYELCEPDFQSNLGTYVVIAGEDNQEASHIANELNTKLGNSKVIQYTVLMYPARIEGNSMVWGGSEIIRNCPVAPLIQYCANIKNSAKPLGKSTIKTLHTGADNHANNLKQEFFDQIKAEIMKEFETTLHHHADDYFQNNDRKCTIM